MSYITVQQMDAVVMVASGPPAESLAIRSEPVPEPGSGEVLVEVHASGVNPLDAVNALGLLGTPLPMVPGVDYAGVVVGMISIGMLGLATAWLVEYVGRRINRWLPRAAR